MGVKLSQVRNDVSAEEEGTWVRLHSFPDVRVRVRSLASEAVQTARRKATAQFKVHFEWRGDDLDAQRRREWAEECRNMRMLRAAVVEIDGIEEDDGTPLKIQDLEERGLFADPALGTQLEADENARFWRYLRIDLWMVLGRLDEEAKAALAAAGKAPSTA